jgi:hypothetical protein
MSENSVDIDEIASSIKSLERKANGLLQDKKDGEDIAGEREDIKEEYEEINEEYKAALKGLKGAEKEAFKTEYGEKLAKAKQVISKL